MDITPRAGSPDPADVAADLRALADLAAADPFVAAMLTNLISDNSIFPVHSADYSHAHQQRDVMAEAIRRFKPAAAAPIRKEYPGDFFYAKVPMKAITLRLAEERAAVCERVVTGIETVTETVPDPEYIAPTVTVTREVETVEWRCGPVLG